MFKKTGIITFLFLFGVIVVFGYIITMGLLNFKNQTVLLKQDIAKLENKINVNITDNTEIRPEGKVYSNSFYKFSLTMPEDKDHCLNDYCINDMADKDIQFFSLVDRNQFQILPRKNNLGMSAVEFAKELIQLNRLYADNPDIKNIEEKQSKFAGQDAYEFIAVGGFEERGLKYAMAAEDGVVKSEEVKKAGEGIILETEHKVIYFDHNGYMYRIIYPYNPEAEKIINSFRFID